MLEIPAELKSMNLPKKILFCTILFCLLILNGSRSESCPNSMVPIIETPNSEIKIYVGIPFTLTYIIIDDNPFNYSLKRNGKLLDFGRLEYSILSFTRQEPEGVYNFTLKITDFSHNNATKNISVTVEPGGPPTTGPTGSTGVLAVFPFLPSILGILILQRRKSTSKRLAKKD